MNKVELYSALTLLRVLVAQKYTVRIINLIKDKPMYVKDICTHVDGSYSQISKCLKKLKNFGIVDYNKVSSPIRSGSRHYYYINNNRWNEVKESIHILTTFKKDVVQTAKEDAIDEWEEIYYDNSGLPQIPDDY